MGLRKGRLWKLIRFLQTLPPEKFNFGSTIKKGSCGTVGCAIGWTPAVFPKLCKVTKFPSGHLTINNTDYGTVAEDILGIPHQVAMNLFSPLGQELVHKDLGDCGRHEGPAVVAEMLIEFIRLVEAGEIKL